MGEEGREEVWKKILNKLLSISKISNKLLSTVQNLDTYSTKLREKLTHEHKKNRE